MQEEIPSSSPDPSVEPIRFLDTTQVDTTWASREMYPQQQITAAAEPVADASPEKTPPVTHPPSSRAWVTIFGWLIAAIVVLMGARFFVPNLAEEIQYSITRGRQRAEYESAGRQLGDSPLNELSNSFRLVSQRVGPSVVHINTTSLDAEEKQDAQNLLGHRRRRRQGQGSGVIMEDDGFILTNYHVIRNSSKIDVHLSDGRTVEALQVGYDPETDLALLKVDADKLIAAEWGDSDHLDVGSLVWAVGSPFGLERSITFGILSAKNRAGQAGTVYQDFLQTDAAVNPGNSGGPLVDAKGRVVGINTAIVGQTYQGISFAIPSDVARDVYQRLKTEHRVARGWLGVSLEVVDRERAKTLGLPEARGAFIDLVVDDFGPSPAGDAGVQVGDVVVQFNGVEIDDPMALSRQVAKAAVGSRARMLLYRDGQPMSLEVVLAERPKLDP